jgi:hypothetical protein
MICHVLGAFVLLDIAMLRPFSLAGRLETYEKFIFFNFLIYFGPR